MKIVLATPVYPPEIGGPATYTVELAKRLAKDNELTVVAYADAPKPLEGVKLFSVSKKQPTFFRLVKYFFVLFRAAKHADVLYVQNAVAAGLPALCVGKLRRVRVVLKFVGDEAWERAAQSGKTTKNLEAFLRSPDGGVKSRMLLGLQGFVLRNVDCTTTPSAYLRDELIRAYRLKPAKVVVNYNASQTFNATPANRITQQVVAMGRLVAWKGVGGVIRALKIVRETLPGAHLVVVGDGPERQNLEEMVARQGAESYVEFTGLVSHEKALQILGESEVFVLNSTYEGLPHAVLDAFATHTPVVASDISGTKEVVVNEVTGLLVTSDVDAALARAIERCLTDSMLRQRLVDAGAQELQKKFSWAAHLKTLHAIFAPHV